MSCIAGFFLWGPRPPAGGGLAAMLDAMHARAPHGRIHHEVARVGLGLQWLRTGGSGPEALPRLNLGESVWMVADARVDARPELLPRLRAAGRTVSADAPHGELLLHAYMAWGIDFPLQVLGDFAFAIWDARTQRLHLGRDRFGVRRLYWQRFATGVAFASEPEAIEGFSGGRLTPSERSMADVLLFGSLLDPTASMYAEVAAVLPAGCLSVEPDGNSREQVYWSLAPIPNKPRLHPVEAKEEFARRFALAVKDRLPDGPAVCELTGGMDSTAIAAIAAPELHAAGHALIGQHVRARAQGEEDEARHAGMAAKRLGIPLQSFALDDHPMWHNALSPQARRRMPTAYPFTGVDLDTAEAALASGAHVVFSGHFGDALYIPHRDHYAELGRTGRWLALANAMWDHWRQTGNLRGLGLRRLNPRYRGPGASRTPQMPGWIEQDWVERLALRERWHDWWVGLCEAEERVAHLNLPTVIRTLDLSEALPCPLQTRYPFLDLRLIEWAECLPNYWLIDKRVMRASMSDRLPREVLSRPKTVVAGDPVRELARGGAQGRLALDWRGNCSGVSLIRHDQAWNVYLTQPADGSTWQSWLIEAPVGLGAWLQQQIRE